MIKKLIFSTVLLLFTYSFSPVYAQDSEEPVDNTEQFVEETFSDRINSFFEPIVAKMAMVLFFDPFEALGLHDPVIYDEQGNPVLDEQGNPMKSQIPMIVVWLIMGALFFTIYMGFINFRGFKHAIDVVRGRYDNPDDAGEVTHFQALTTALSATVGLGNIASLSRLW